MPYICIYVRTIPHKKHNLHYQFICIVGHFRVITMSMNLKRLLRNLSRISELASVSGGQ
jgi:hypothetical protein